jgi:hypothetical protein
MAGPTSPGVAGAAGPGPAGKAVDYSYWEMSSARVNERMPPPEQFLNRDAYRAQAQRLCAELQLAEWTRDSIQAIVPFGDGNDGQIFQLFRDNVKYALKRFKDGISLQLIEFQEVLQRATAQADVVDSDRGRGHVDSAVIALVRRAAKPIAYVLHMDQICLAYEWIANDPERQITTTDLRSLRAQLDLCHALGFCHLDVTQRNILLTDQTAILMDYDCVTKIGTSPLCGIAPENCARVKSRDCVRVEDDEHLWNQLKPIVDLKSRLNPHFPLTLLLSLCAAGCIIGLILLLVLNEDKNGFEFFYPFFMLLMGAILCSVFAVIVCDAYRRALVDSVGLIHAAGRD